MKIKSLYKIFLSVFITLNGLQQVTAQNNFAYKALIDTIRDTGFYKLNLAPKIIAKCKPGLEDIRIFDDEQKQVSYILKNDLPIFRKENFTEFPLIATVKGADKQTHVTIQNNANRSVNSLLLFVKNTDASRTFNISGSDDGLQWFVIKENIHLESSLQKDDEAIIQALSFPASSYKYFQLTILGKDVLPFNILRAGIYTEDLSYGSYLELPAPIITQKDSSDKMSYINIHFDENYLIDKIIIDAVGAKFFKRKFSLFKKHDVNDLILEGFLSSQVADEFIINTKGNDFLLRIGNEDNSPLKLNTVTAFQLNTYLLTYLSKAKYYSLYFGDSMASAPKYDLSFFSDSAGKGPSERFVSNFEKNIDMVTANPASGKSSKLFLWVIIAVVLAALSYFTFKMLGEVNKKSSDSVQ